MGTLDNPAGRLHLILTQYREASADNKTVLDTWAEVLGVERSGVLRELSLVAWLIPQTQRAVERSESEEWRAVCDHYVDTWARPIFFPDRPGGKTPSGGKKAVDPGALATLGGLSAFLSNVASEGTVPPEEDRAALLTDLEGVIEQVATTDELTLELRELLLDRLGDVKWALERVALLGPDGVKSATERLAFQASTASHEDDRGNQSYKSALAWAAGVWWAFTQGPTVHSALEGWRDVARHILNAGS